MVRSIKCYPNELLGMTKMANVCCLIWPRHRAESSFWPQALLKKGGKHRTSGCLRALTVGPNQWCKNGQKHRASPRIRNHVGHKMLEPLADDWIMTWNHALKLQESTTEERVCDSTPRELGAPRWHAATGRCTKHPRAKDLTGGKRWNKTTWILLAYKRLPLEKALGFNDISVPRIFPDGILQGFPLCLTGPGQ